MSTGWESDASRCRRRPPAQLNLPENQGLLVGDVVPDSPAGKAKIVQYDLLLSAAGKPLSSPRDLMKAVDAAKEGKLSLELLHQGKRQTMEISPAKRPEDARRNVPPLPGDAEWQAAQKWMEQMQPGEKKEGQPPIVLRFFHPGAIVSGEAMLQSPLPAELSIVISKEGDQLTKIAVKRGKDKWEVTEKELDKLPADIRPHVERMLGRGGVAGIMGGTLNVGPGGPLPPGAVDGSLRKQVEEMNRRMEQLLKQMEQPRPSREAKPAEEEAPENPESK